jgi:serine/threonine-protein kinase
VHIARGVCSSLAEAHGLGIVHRDLKPANVFLHRPGTGALVPKVLDFGISKIASSGAPELAGGLTQTGAILGSPLYMSPEQAASDKSIDGRSDLHALGVVMWECLVGQPPFNGDTYNNLVVQIITGERPRLVDALPSLPEPVCQVVDRAMARKREDRFQRAEEMAEAIEAALVGMPGTSVTARTSAAELFSRVLPSVDPGPLVPETSVRGSTTGGMWVPSAGAPRSDLSPAAMTTTPPVPRSVSRTAFDDTRPASSSNVAATISDGALAAPVVTASSGQTSALTTGSSAKSSSRAWALVAGGVVITLAGAIVVAVALGGRHAPATSGGSAGITAEPPAAMSLAAPAQQAPAASLGAASQDPPPASGPASSAATAASAAPTLRSPSRWTTAASARTTPAIATTTARPAPRTTAPGRNDSVESSGF